MKKTSSADRGIQFLHECFKTGHSVDLEIRQRLSKRMFERISGILDDPAMHVLGRWKSWCNGPYHIPNIHSVGIPKLTALTAFLSDEKIKHRFTTTFSV